MFKKSNMPATLPFFVNEASFARREIRSFYVFLKLSSQNHEK